MEKGRQRVEEEGAQEDTQRQSQLFRADRPCAAVCSRNVMHLLGSVGADVGRE